MLSYSQFCAENLGVSSVTVLQRVEIKMFEREHLAGRVGSCWLGRLGVRILAEVFSSRKQSIPTLEFIQPHIHCVHVFFAVGNAAGP